MKYKISFLPLLLAGMLASCNSDEELIQTNPNYVEAGYGALTITLSNPGSGLTKAGETIDVATAEEKTISSVAFFVRTKAETIDGTVMAGKFGSYFSTEEPLSANGLQEELAEVSAGEYTAKIRHKSDGWEDPQVIVIANYAENGLTETLKGIQNWDDLVSIQTDLLTANPQTPLLMYATKTIEAWKRQTGGNGGGVASETFELQRLVSRIDIHNNAYNATDNNLGFVLTSAQLIRPKTTSYLIPENATTGDLAVSAQPFPISGTVEVDGDVQKLDTLYAYENANDVEATATAVQVNGTYRGGNISKIIPFKKADGVGETGAPIALARNTRYVININPAPDSTDIIWNIQVKDWTESDTIKVKPVFPIPVLEDIDASGLGNNWDLATKTITTDGTATASMTFKTVGTTASIYKIAYKYDTDGSSIDLASVPDGIVVAGDPIITYAAQVETPFTVNVPKSKTDEAVPVDIYVIIQNGGNTDACDTITIKSRPDYNGLTGLKPVLMKSGKFWAPVNAGATAIPTSVPTTGDITSTCGNIFQWGRIYGFPASTDAVQTTAELVSDTAGFESNDPWKGKFITSSTSPYDWLSSQIDNLWNSGSEAKPVKTSSDPCPKGWRVPTFAEWEAIGAGKTEITKDWDSTNKLMTITGEDGNLVLPAAGFRGRTNGSSYNLGSNGNYWASSVSGTIGRNVYFSSASLNANTNYRAYGYSVRCVQE